MSEVTVYTRHLCGYCLAAKNLLKKKGVAFTEHDASFDPELRRQMASRAGGATTFPQIFVGEIHIGGCDELMAMDRAGKLDPLLNASV